MDFQEKFDNEIDATLQALGTLDGTTIETAEAERKLIDAISEKAARYDQLMRHDLSSTQQLSRRLDDKQLQDTLRDSLSKMRNWISDSLEHANSQVGSISNELDYKNAANAFMDKFGKLAGAAGTAKGYYDLGSSALAGSNADFGRSLAKAAGVGLAGILAAGMGFTGLPGLALVGIAAYAIPEMIDAILPDSLAHEIGEALSWIKNGAQFLSDGLADALRALLITCFQT